LNALEESRRKLRRLKMEEEGGDEDCYNDEE
jgi:hypothetical protein